MGKIELLKELRSSKKLYTYVAYNDDNGGYFQMVKSDFIKAVLEMDENADFSNVSVTDNAIYIN